MFIRIPSFLAFILILLGTSTSHAQEPGALTYSWALSSSTVTLGEPVLAELEIFNGAREARQIDLGADMLEGLLLLVRISDQQVFESEPYWTSGTHTIGKVDLEAGSTFRRTYVLDFWYPFEAEGMYELQLLPREPFSETAISTDSDSAVQQVTVLPRNTDMLQTSSEAYVQTLLTCCDSDKMILAATALFYTHDPEVIPYLLRALETRHLYARNLIVDALGNFNHPLTLRALLNIAISSHPERYDSVIAIRNLSRLMSAVSDQALQTEIHAFLESRNSLPAPGVSTQRIPERPVD